MKTLTLHVIIAAIYTWLGYLSFNQALSIFLHGYSGTDADSGTLLIAPVYAALFYFIFYVVSSFIFKKVATLNIRKEIIFQIAFLIVNILFFLIVCQLFSWRVSAELAGATQILHADNLHFMGSYLIASMATLIIFLGVRVKCR